MPDMVPFGMKSPRKENRQPKLTVISAVMRAAYSRVAGTILPVATVSPLLSIRRWIERLINCVPIRLCRSHDVLPRLAQRGSYVRSESCPIVSALRTIQCREW
jgi:hypothetical protein